jgi:hypothetical protein
VTFHGNHAQAALAGQVLEIPRVIMPSDALGQAHRH